MKPASFLGLVVCASFVVASGSALAAPGSGGDAPKKKKPKTSVSAKAPKKTDAAADKSAAPAADPAPAPVAPEPKAADTKPAEVKPVPVASTSAASAPDADHPTDSKKGDDDAAGKAFSAAPLLGFGTNHFGFGTGVRGGYTLPAKVYVGATFMYHFGSTYGYGGYLGGADYSTHILYPAGEVGYDFHVGPVTIRPYAGVGIAFVTASISYAGRSDDASTSSLLLYPGATAFWNIPKTDFFVGGDTRMLILTRGGDPSFDLFATAGIKF